MGRSDRLFQRRKAATAEALRRRDSERAANKRVLIVCEGEKTEQLYFECLVHSLSLVSVDVEISGDSDSSPRSVVQHAKERAQAEGRPEDGGYDAVFCVFDRDTHETYEEAKGTVLALRKEGIFPRIAEFAITSIPCFEYWFLLHFSYARAPFAATNTKTAAVAVMGSLREIAGFQSYEKAIGKSQLESLIARRDDAVANSKRALQDVEATGEANPSTYVHVIVEFLAGVNG